MDQGFTTTPTNFEADLAAQGFAPPLAAAVQAVWDATDKSLDVSYEVSVAVAPAEGCWLVIRVAAVKGV